MQQSCSLSRLDVCRQLSSVWPTGELLGDDRPPWQQQCIHSAPTDALQPSPFVIAAPTLGVPRPASQATTEICYRARDAASQLPTSDLTPTYPSPLNNGAMSSQKEDTKPVVLKGPSALRSIIAGSTAGAIEIGALVLAP